MLSWIKTNRTPYTLAAVDAPAQISRYDDVALTTWMAQVDLPAGEVRYAAHRSPQAAMAWCEREVAFLSDLKQRMA